jgi:hypothetical protein
MVSALSYVVTSYELVSIDISTGTKKFGERESTDRFTILRHFYYKEI